MTSPTEIICRRDDQGVALTNVPQVEATHSPDGFEWGYGGSGPAEFAQNILRAFGLNQATAWRHHQHFKRDFIVSMPASGGAITITAVITWLQARGVRVNPSAIKLSDRLLYSGMEDKTPLPSPDKLRIVSIRRVTMSGRFINRSEFDAWIAEARRDRSPEHDFGGFWSRADAPSEGRFRGQSTLNEFWRISWIEDTGELYGVCERTGQGLVFDRHIPTVDDVEALLDGWASTPLCIGPLCNTESLHILRATPPESE